MIERNTVSSTGSSHVSGSGTTSQGGARSNGVSHLSYARKEKDQRVLVVGCGISIKGTIQDVDRLVIEGVVESELVHVKELVVMAGGIFRGDGDVEDAEIAGTFEGGLTANGILTICYTGHLVGKASCHRLKIDDGGQVTGQLEMLKKKKPDSGEQSVSVVPKSVKKQDSLAK